MNAKYALPATLFAAAFLAGCGGAPDLTKDQAKALINDYFKQNPVTQPLLTGMDNIGQETEAAYFTKGGGKYQKALENDGLITVTSKGKIVKPDDRSQWFFGLDIALTDKAKPFITGKPQTVPAQPPQWATVYENAVFCTKEVANISDPQTNDTSATVDYGWKAGSLTPFANHFHETDPTEKSTCNTDLVVTANASFELKNNVWALTVAQ